MVLVISANMWTQLTDAHRRFLSELVTQWEAHSSCFICTDNHMRWTTVRLLNPVDYKTDPCCLLLWHLWLSPKLIQDSGLWRGVVCLHLKVQEPQISLRCLIKAALGHTGMWTEIVVAWQRPRGYRNLERLKSHTLNETKEEKPVLKTQQVNKHQHSRADDPQRPARSRKNCSQGQRSCISAHLCCGFVCVRAHTPTPPSSVEGNNIFTDLLNLPLRAGS